MQQDGLSKSLFEIPIWFEIPVWNQFPVFMAPGECAVYGAAVSVTAVLVTAVSIVTVLKAAVSNAWLGR